MNERIMFGIARLLRGWAKIKFRLLGHATIEDINGDKFKEVISALQSQGWRVTSRYFNFDAGIDYDCIRMRRGFATLKCEWDNWSEWSIEGSRTIIEKIAAENALTVTHAWRWSAYDPAGGNET
ncbi:MAG: hypothetical protein LBE81_11710 [Azonexus sp.]|uniref:hypothetical protein n=1 Tax=Azonexus sp. TaxID=1872668 RepID=UPI0028175D48|nr:hypothetical protein [Azonexus sp.]MDR0777285.1 hypothetical protein [Azonexus sp.]